MAKLIKVLELMKNPQKLENSNIKVVLGERVICKTFDKGILPDGIIVDYWNPLEQKYATKFYNENEYVHVE